MSYDAWKTRVPDWPSGDSSPEADIRRAFWHAFHYAQRNRCLDQFWAVYAPLQSPIFVPLVQQAKQLLHEMDAA